MEISQYFAIWIDFKLYSLVNMSIVTDIVSLDKECAALVEPLSVRALQRIREGLPSTTGRIPCGVALPMFKYRHESQREGYQR